MGGLCRTPTPSATPRDSATATGTPIPPDGATATATRTSTRTATRSATRTASATRTRTATATATPTVTASATPSATPTPCVPAPLALIAGPAVLSGTLLADSCGNAPPTIANDAVSIGVAGDVISIFSTAAVRGAYDESDCAWRGEGIRTIPNTPPLLLHEIYDGTWTQEPNGDVVFYGTLTFVFLDLASREEICRTTYRVKLRRQVAP
jgi:hypothetical protein